MYQKIEELLSFQADAVRDPQGWSQNVKMTAKRREGVDILTALRPQVPHEYLFCDGTQHLFVVKVDGRYSLIAGETDGLDAMETDYGRMVAEPHKRRILLDAKDGSRWQFDSKGWKALKKANSALETTTAVKTPLIALICQGLLDRGIQAVEEGLQAVVNFNGNLFVVEAHGNVVLTSDAGLELELDEVLVED
jgi:hypothetical protein